MTTCASPVVTTAAFNQVDSPAKISTVAAVITSPRKTVSKDEKTNDVTELLSNGPLFHVSFL